MSLAENEVDEERREFCTFHTKYAKRQTMRKRLDYVQKQQEKKVQQRHENDLTNQQKNASPFLTLHLL
jgi:hypothetical protein